jgi:hypothetical protein
MPRSTWTNEETKLLTSLYGKVPMDDLIAKHFPHKNRAAIKWQVERLRLGQAVEWTDKDKELLKILASCNVPAAVTAQLLNRPRQAVNVMACKLGFKRATRDEQILASALQQRSRYNTLDSLTKGTLNELAVVSALMERGFNVFRPLTINHKTDLVVLHGRRLLRLQVKASIYDSKTNRYRVPLRSRAINKGIRTTYKNEDLDFFIITCPGVDELYVIPYSVGVKTEFANLYPARTKQQHVGVDFEQFRDRFDLLEAALARCKIQNTWKPAVVDPRQTRKPLLSSHRREWLPWEEHVLRLLTAHGAPLSSAAVALNRSRASILMASRRLGLAGAKLNDHSDDQLSEFSRSSKCLGGRTLGVITENHVANILLSLGYDVFVPCRTNDRVDHLLVHARTSVRLQVKGASYDCKSRSFRAMVSRKSMKTGEWKPYSEDEVDVVVVSCGLSVELYVIPLKEVRLLRTICLYPHRHIFSKRGKSYEQFRGRFDVIDRLLCRSG